MAAQKFTNFDKFFLTIVTIQPNKVVLNEVKRQLGTTRAMVQKKM